MKKILLAMLMVLFLTVPTFAAGLHLTGLTSANSRCSFASGSSWIQFEGQDFSAYGQTGKWFIRAYDSAGAVAEGYPDVVGSGETLGDERWRDPSFDDDTKWVEGVGWVVAGGNATKTPGVASLLDDVNPTGSTVGQLIKRNVVITSVSAGLVSYPYDGSGGMLSFTPVSSGTHTKYWASVTTAGVHLIYANATSDCVLASTSVKQITEPAATGIHILDGPSGSSGWAKIDSGFDYNDIVEIEIVPNATIQGVTLAGVSVNAESLFIFEAKTTGAAETFTLPIYNDGTYDFLIDWGDSQADTITAWNDAAVTHTYAVAGTYQVMISGTIIGWRFINGGDKAKIYNISSWGPLRLGNNKGYFYGCSNLTVSATDELDLTGTTDFQHAFRNCTSLTTLDVSSWETGLVTDFSIAFYGCTSLTTLDVSLWDTGLVTDFSNAFFGCSSLTDPAINNWDIADVTDMTNFMNGAKALSTAVYDATLIAWEAQNPLNTVVTHFGTSKYTGGGVAAAARAHLVLAVGSGGHGWTITDGGIAP